VSSPETTIRFAEFAVDLEAGELLRNGTKLKLRGQPFEILALLLRQPGRIVTREELRRRLWPSDTFVDFEHSLNAAVNRLREALGDSAEDPSYIETVPRRGYRFIASVDADALNVPSKRHLDHYFRGWKLPLVIASLSLVFVIGFGIVFWVSWHKRQPLAPSSTVKIFPLTGAIGEEQQPALSPDGTRIAYVWRGEAQSNFNLYVKLIGAGRPLRLTSNGEEESCPAWSPDGRYIAFLRGDNDIYIVPSLGGFERRLTHSAWNYGIVRSYLSSCLAWSPDGKLLATVDRSSLNEPLSIFLVSVEDGKKWKVTSPPANSEQLPYQGDRNPAFSPNGRTLAFVRGYDAGNDIFLQDITGNSVPIAAPRRLTFDNANVVGLDWTADGHSIVFSSFRSGSPRLWRIYREAASKKTEPEPIPSGDHAVLPTVARKVGWLAYQQSSGKAFISQLELSDAGQSRAPSRFCPSSQGDVSPQFSPDGSKVAFASTRSGDFEIWLCDIDGSNPTQLTSSGGGLPGSPTWSPDGQRVAFDYHGPEGHPEIRVVGVAQGMPLHITLGNSIVDRPSWSNDGKWIYFGSNATGDFQVWKVPSLGGTASQVSKRGGWEARESPDGRYLYYVKYHASWLINPPVRSGGIWRIPIGGGEETQFLDHGEPGLWTLTRRGIYLLNLLPGGPAVEFYSFATQRLTRIATLPEDTRLDTASPAFTVSADGQTILYGQVTLGGNIVVIENFR